MARQAGLLEKKLVWWWFGPFPVSGTAFRRHVLMSCALFCWVWSGCRGFRSDHFFFTGKPEDGAGHATAARQSQAFR